MTPHLSHRRDPLRAVPVLALLAAVGCGPEDADDPFRQGSTTPMPAAAIAEPPDALDLPERLDRLVAAIESARAAGDGDELLARATRAEAITDRLLEDEPRLVWLAHGYSVEARLRQLQVMADRVLALARRGASRGTVNEELTAFAASAATLRNQLETEGRPLAPPPLDSLLRDTAAFRRSPAEALGRSATGGPPPAPATESRAAPALLGTPVDTSGG